ncbi:MAG: DivIVA domain-containing protein [Acidimicrobiia bacterium]|nr:DivIVA domain-containing protein [Acidimicrobiia bacterium]
MDVTPRELRDTDIREAWRGYSREEVDELLERAAATIERQAGQVRSLTEKLGGLESETARNRETEDMLHRTLLLAQRTADEAVTEAQAKARKTLEDAETKAHMLVSDAEATARRTADAERRGLETAVRDLGARRDALLADIANLESFEAGYRDRLREVIEADLSTLQSRGPAHASPPPALHEVEIPAPTGPEAAAAEPAPAEGSSDAPDGSGLPGVPPAGEIGLGKFGPPRPEAVGASGGAGTGDATEAMSHPSPGERSGAEVDLAGAEAGAAADSRRLFVDEPADPAALTDDAFFASLREAVDSDAPLGPGDPAAPAGSAPSTPEAELVDLDDTGSRLGNAFRRRR